MGTCLSHVTSQGMPGETTLPLDETVLGILMVRNLHITTTTTVNFNDLRQITNKRI